MDEVDDLKLSKRDARGKLRGWDERDLYDLTEWMVEDYGDRDLHLYKHIDLDEARQTSRNDGLYNTISQINTKELHMDVCSTAMYDTDPASMFPSLPRRKQCGCLLNQGRV